jgi:large subunit ribosomal protein L31
MKQGIHPEYGYVVFRDRAAGRSFLTRSTLTSEETVEWKDGNTYPVIDVQISSASHPFWTGKNRALDDEGRVAKFYRKYGGSPEGDDRP